MTRAHLFREYARIIEMCEGSDVHPTECVKVNGIAWSGISARCAPNSRKGDIAFDVDPKIYTFALFILENKPVFAGDNLYLRDDEINVTGTRNGESMLFNWKLGDDAISLDNSVVSWNPPAPKTRRVRIYSDENLLIDFDMEHGNTAVFPVSSLDGEMEVIVRWI